MNIKRRMRVAVCGYDCGMSLGEVLSGWGGSRGLVSNKSPGSQPQHKEGCVIQGPQHLSILSRAHLGQLADGVVRPS